MQRTVRKSLHLERPQRLFISRKAGRHAILDQCSLGLESCAGLLHWFTSPYVHRLAYDAASGVVETRTLNVLARPRVDRFPASAVRYPQTLQPQATFQVRNVCNCVGNVRCYLVCATTISTNKAEFENGACCDPIPPPVQLVLAPALAPESQCLTCELQLQLRRVSPRAFA